MAALPGTESRSGELASRALASLARARERSRAVSARRSISATAAALCSGPAVAAATDLTTERDEVRVQAEAWRGHSRTPRSAYWERHFVPDAEVRAAKGHISSQNGSLGRVPLRRIAVRSHPPPVEILPRPVAGAELASLADSTTPVAAFGVCCAASAAQSVLPAWCPLVPCRASAC